MQELSSGLARNPRLAEFVLALGGFGIGTSEFVILMAGIKKPAEAGLD